MTNVVFNFLVSVHHFLFSKHFRLDLFCTKFGCWMMYTVSMIFFYIYCAKGNGSMNTVFKIKFIKLHLPERNFIHTSGCCTSKPLFQVHSLGVLPRWVNTRSLHFYYSNIITLCDIPCVFQINCRTLKRMKTSDHLSKVKFSLHKCH